MKKGRKRRIQEVASEERTVVIYESPHRIKRLLAELAEACGAERKVALARELTKHYEEFVRGTLAEVLDRVTERFPESVKGECVVVLEGHPATRGKGSRPEMGELVQDDEDEGI